MGAAGVVLAAHGTVNGEPKMTTAQTLALRCSEIRQRLNEITGLEGDAFTDEIRQESDKLGTEYRDVETKWRAAERSEGDASLTAGSQFLTGGSAEDRAYRELVGKADLGAIFEAVVEKRSTSGAEAEIQKHHKLTAHQVPLDVLRGPAVEEHRAVATVPTNVETAQQPTIMPVFATGDMAYLGVDQPSVPTGDAVFPVLSSRPDVRGPFTASDEATEDGRHLCGRPAQAVTCAGCVSLPADRRGPLRRHGRVVALGAERGARGSARQRGYLRNERPAHGDEPRESRAVGGFHIREVHQRVWVLAS